MLEVVVELDTGDGGDDSGLVPLPPLGVLEVIQPLVRGVPLTSQEPLQHCSVRGWSLITLYKNKTINYYSILVVILYLIGKSSLFLNKLCHNCENKTGMAFELDICIYILVRQK